MFDLIAERKIAEAIANGELDHLPGEGRPLDLDEDALVPEDLRLAYRILKNAGYATVEEVEVMPENVRFGLPPEIVEAIAPAPAVAAE